MKALRTPAFAPLVTFVHPRLRKLDAPLARTAKQVLFPKLIARLVNSVLIAAPRRPVPPAHSAPQDPLATLLVLQAHFAVHQHLKRAVNLAVRAQKEGRVRSIAQRDIIVIHLLPCQ